MFESSEDNYVTIELRINEATDDAAFPNLFTQRIGKVITVKVPSSITQDSLKLGKTISTRLRLVNSNLAFLDADEFVRVP
jgi:hypothetical protein